MGVSPAAKVLRCFDWPPPRADARTSPASGRKRGREDQSSFANSRRISLPVLVIGSDGTKLTARGTL